MASRRSLLVSALSLTLGHAACTGGAPPPSTAAAAPAAAPLRDEAGRDEPLSERVARSNLTVLLFFSSDCPVQKAHDARIRALVDGYGARGVAFYAIASEVGVDVAAEREAARRRGLAVPLLEDRGAALADALGVDYSTHAVVLDRDRRVLYSGGIDSDRTHLAPNAERWLADALDASLAGRTIAKARTEPLGCPLRKH